MKTTVVTLNSAAGVPDSTDPSLVVQKVTTLQAAPYFGQQLATGVPAALPSVELVNGISIIASPNNDGVIMCGLTSTLNAKNDGTGTGYALAPGQPMPGLAITNLNQLAIVLASGNTSATDFVCIAGN